MKFKNQSTETAYDRLFADWYWSPEETTFKDIASFEQYVSDNVQTSGDFDDVMLHEIDTMNLAEIIAEKHPELITGIDTQDGEELEDL